MAETPKESSSDVIVRRKKRPYLLDMLVRLFKTKPLGALGFVIVILLFLTGIFADFLSPFGWNEIMLQHRLAPPNPELLLGADNVGRDLLSRIIHGARISMTVALGAQTINLVVKLALAVPSGYFGGKYDLILQRFIDAWICFPMLALYLTVMAVLGPGIWQVILVLGVSGGIGGTRVIRAAVIRIREEMYFEAARAIGVPTRRIMMKHVIPNIASVVVINLAGGMGGVILAESSLSFLGFGIPPPFPSWGGMLSGAGRQFMMVAPWMMLWPGLALSSVIFGFNMLADAIRDLMDPRLRGGLGRYGGMSQEQLQKLAAKKSRQIADA
ncbi:MAG: ABC transporter permease [Dehalococcoidales bacterium]|jgi:peptide/nickel transport system permease protein|nr:ABC transporter permease [Dehalococcoidales bacterium]